MNRDDVIRWATQCKMPYDFVTGEIVQIEKLERFAALVAAAKREACAQFLESTQLGSLPDDTALHYARLLKGFAEGIRARKENT